MGKLKDSFMRTILNFQTMLLPVLILLAIFISLSLAAVAQESAKKASPTETESNEATSEQEVVTLESMVVVGTRAKPRSVLESAVPIDVLPSEEFVKQGGADLPDLLRNLVPSYNVNAQPIADAATVVRPANLRGLAPDHTLLLVNGKRRHRASVIAWLGNGLSDGAQGADFSPIPSIALKQVEVLRDGASAQYGSDAIAGVMNLQLKDNYNAGAFEIKPGIYQVGDGLTYSLAGNIGLGREDLWTNLSLEYGGMNETDRSVQRDDAAALISAGNTDVADPAQSWGHPIIRNDIKLFANYGASLTDKIKFYGHANYAQREVEGGFYFRNPNTRGAVFSNDDGETLLVGRLAGTGEVPVVKITDNVPDPVALKQVIDDPNLFTFQQMFPGGFTPRFGADTQDASLLVGLKGAIVEDLGWDLSAAYGRHASDFFIKNTVNASLGPDTPTEFDHGNYIQSAIVGPDYSDEAIEAGVVAQRHGIPMVTTYPTNPKVTKSGNYVFMTAFIDSYQARIMADFAIEKLEAMTAAILTETGDSHSEGLSTFFTDDFTAQGGTIAVQQFYESGATDFTQQLLAIAAVEPAVDIIFLAGLGSEFPLAVKQTRSDDIGISATFLGGDGWDRPDLIEIGGMALEGSFFANSFSPDGLKSLVINTVKDGKIQFHQFIQP